MEKRKLTSIELYKPTDLLECCLIDTTTFDNVIQGLIGEGEDIEEFMQLPYLGWSKIEEYNVSLKLENSISHLGSIEEISLSKVRIVAFIENIDKIVLNFTNDNRVTLEEFLLLNNMDGSFKKKKGYIGYRFNDIENLSNLIIKKYNKTRVNEDVYGNEVKYNIELILNYH